MDTAPVIDLAEVRQAEEKRQHLADLDAQLLKSDKNAVLGIVSNLILIIARDPVLAGLCGYNEFTCQFVLHASPPPMLDGSPLTPGPYPRPWQPADVSHIQSYIQRVWTRQAGREDTEQAMSAVASDRRFHPVRDWLATLKWDGSPRMDAWLTKAFGAEDTDYVAAVAAKILIAAVRRVRFPGCKFDHMPILEGAQGIGKSKTLAALFGADWLADSLPPQLDSRDAALGLVGIWAVELAEIEQIIRAEVEVIKAFLSRPIDRFRAPYGRGFLTYPRQCILVGTTNSADYLRDDTGNRRFWPFRCTRADVEWISLNRDQLWAEASAREDAGEPTYLENPDVQAEAAEAQANRMLEDDWHGKVADYIQSFQTTTTSAVLEHCIQMPVKDHNRSAQMRAGAILTTLGWVKVVGWKSGKTARWWERAPSRS